MLYIIPGEYDGHYDAPCIASNYHFYITSTILMTLVAAGELCWLRLLSWSRKMVVVIGQPVGMLELGASAMFLSISLDGHAKSSKTRKSSYLGGSR